MIRDATPDDLESIIALGEAMHAESPRFNGMPFDPGRLRALAPTLFADGIVLVAESSEGVVGMAVGFVTPHFFCNVVTASDLAIYVLPASRGGRWAVKLIRAFEDRARVKGAAEAVLGISTEVAADRTAGLYEGLGYRRSGVILVKQLGDVCVTRT